MKTILASIVQSVLLMTWPLSASGQVLTRAACEANIEKELTRMAEGVAAGPYKADWESLKEHQEAPDWFRDAKIGIYFHWGVYTVPAYGNEWYAQRMHLKTGSFSPGILQIDDATDGRVELIGHPGELRYRVDGKRLSIDVPAQPPCDYAYAFKLTGFKTSIIAAAASARDEALKELQAGSSDPAKVKAKRAKKERKK
jgi:hypothetical protein